MISEKECSKCKNVLPISRFNKSKISPSGFQYICRGCAKEGFKKNLETLDGRIKQLLSTSRFSAKAKNREWNLSFEILVNLYLEQQGLCAMTGEELTFERFSENLISLDRIDSSKGYTEDNIQLVTFNVNIAKNSLEINTFIEMCKKVANRC